MAKPANNPAVPEATKKYGDLLFVQDKHVLIICKPVFENAKGWNEF